VAAESFNTVILSISAGVLTAVWGLLEFFFVF